MEPKSPWEISPALTEERLIKIGNSIVQARAGTVEDQKPEKGDKSWGLGCRAYERECFAIRAMSYMEDEPWLKITQEGLAFSMIVGDTPLRFYCGDAEHPTSKSLLRGWQDKISQSSFDFGQIDSEEGWFWLLAIEKKKDGSADRLVIFQANANREIRNSWEVPCDYQINGFNIVVPLERSGVDLPAPAVGPKQPSLHVVGSSESENDKGS